MVRRVKRAAKGIISIQQEIESHFKKLEKDIAENNLEAGGYHFKELNFSFLPALEKKLKILGKSNGKLDSYKKRLEVLKKKMEL